MTALSGGFDAVRLMGNGPGRLMAAVAAGNAGSPARHYQLSALLAIVKAEAVQLMGEESRS